MSQEEEEGGKKEGRSCKEEGRGRATHQSQFLEGKKKKKSRLILDGLEPRSWRPEEVRVVCGKEREQ